ncbi:MAG: helix-turn-helix transcriptional regulator [Magnetococcales bacterium]|nr:helix-turn-helix transcriptional regulator [Magnetococcales bacterium]
MTLQIIKDRAGRDEYVLLPVRVYEALQEEIDEQLEAQEILAERVDAFDLFDPSDYVKNPVALARMKAGVKQVDLAQRMGVSQAYLSKLENARRVSRDAMAKVRDALEQGDPP